MGTEQTVEVDGRRLRLSNLGKVMYPADGFTKGEVIDWYARIAEVVLPHVAGHPLTLKRFPDGVGGLHFYEKTCPDYRPDWLPTVEVPTSSRTIRFCSVRQRADLVWLANLANLELHPLLQRDGAIEHPTQMVFDLDPGAPAGWPEVTEVALRLRDVLTSVGLVSYVKTSGSKGLHVHVPLGPGHDFDATKRFAHDVSDTFARGLPDLALSSMRKDQRSGRVLIDWSQNDRHKSTVAAYSLRARRHPWVAAPLTWGELEGAQRTRDWSPYLLSPPEVIGRIEQLGDLHGEALELDQYLPY